MYHTSMINLNIYKVDLYAYTCTLKKQTYKKVELFNN